MKVIALLMLVVMGSSACSTVSSQIEGRPSADSLRTSYRLGTGDQIRITVFDEANLSGEFAVSADGSVALPLIGAVRASGRTVSELSIDIRDRLMQGYLRNPRVSVDILAYRPFYILGEVVHPGEYPYSVGLTVMSAVAKAQGFTYRANQKHVFVKSADSASEIEVVLSSSLLVAPGDTIRIGERYF